MKWTNDTINPAGPIQVSRFNKATRNLSSQHATTRTLYGIIGKKQTPGAAWESDCEHESNTLAMFSALRREDVAKVQNDIGERYDWTVSKANVGKIIVDIEAAMPALVAARPTTDKRQTKEQRDAENAQHAIDRQESNKAQAAKTDNKRAVCVAAYGSGETVTLQSGQVGIVAKLCFDNSDSQSDYFDSHASLSIPFLVGILRGRAETESEARRAISGLAGLSDEQHGWEWKTEKWSMGHGNYLTGSKVEVPEEVGALRVGYGGGAIKQGHWEIQFCTQSDNADKHTFDTFKGYGERKQPETPASGQGESAAGGSGATVSKNEEHQGVEVRFEAKPTPDVLSRLKSAGFRWSMRNRVWYKKYSAFAWQVACEIAGVSDEPHSEKQLAKDYDAQRERIKAEGNPLVDLQTKAMDNAEAGFTPDAFDMQVEDNMAAACGL